MTDEAADIRRRDRSSNSSTTRPVTSFRDRAEPFGTRGASESAATRAALARTERTESEQGALALLLRGEDLNGAPRVPKGVYRPRSQSWVKAPAAAERERRATWSKPPRQRKEGVE